MQTFAAIAALVSLASAAAIPSTIFERDGQCSPTTIPNSFYGGQSVGGSTTVAYSYGSRGYQAGGDGSYANPLTAAALNPSQAGSPYTKLEVLYSAWLKKYVIIQDDCASCQTTSQIDVYMYTTGGEAQDTCSDSFTPPAAGTVGNSLFLKNPNPDLPTDTNPMQVNGVCKDNFYSGNTASCS